jgi:hypothetical protein
MEIWYKPPLYTVSHIASGVLSFFIPVIFPFILVYHFLQYFLNIRFFIREKEIRQGNSIAHTGLKIVEVILGLLIAYAIYTWNR